MSDRPSSMPSPATLVGLVAVSSAAALMLEIVAGRLIAPFLGTSLHSWTAIIAVVLAGLSLGALLGGRLADGPLERGRDRLVAALALAAFFSLLAPVLLRRSVALTRGNDLDGVAEVLVVATAMLFVPSVFAGLVSPLATRLALAQTPPEGTGRLLGGIFAAGSAGSIVGTLLAGFVLIGYLGSLASVILIAGIYAVAALAVVAREVATWRPAVVLVAAAGVVWGAGTAIGAWTSPCDAESAYSCVRVEAVPTPNGAGGHALLIDHLTHGTNVRDDADLFVMGYIELADHLARRRFRGVPPRSFFAGGGAYTLPRAWLADGGEVVVAEIDRLVTAVAERRLWLEETPGLTVVHRDARVALAERDERFDVVVGDAFRDVTVPPHLVTHEFAELVRARLAPGGVYLVNVIDDPVRPLFAAAVARTLEAVFADVTVWRRLGDADGARRNYLLAASDRPLARRRVEGVAAYGRRWRTIDLELDAPVLTDDFAPVDRLLRRGAG